MKTAIVYYSKHHNNTQKLITEIAKKQEITMIDVAKNPNADLSGYDLIGFASGIYYSKFHKTVLQFAEKNLPKNSKVFFLYTYGAKKTGYTKAIADSVSKKDAQILGEYGCFGFNTFGPFKLIGGIAKNHPDADELRDAVTFYESLL